MQRQAPVRILHQQRNRGPRTAAELGAIKLDAVFLFFFENNPLVLNRVYHYWTFFSRGLNQVEDWLFRCSIGFRVRAPAFTSLGFRDKPLWRWFNTVDGPNPFRTTLKP